LDAVTGSRSHTNETSKRMAKYVSILFCQPLEVSRNEEVIKKMYDMRSEYVHGRGLEISANDEIALREYVRKFLVAFYFFYCDLKIKAETQIYQKLNSIYSHRRKIVVESLKNIGVEVYAARATFYVWFRVPRGFSSEEFASHVLEKTGVIITPGSAYGTYGEGYCRISLTISEESIEEAMSRICALEVFKKIYPELTSGSIFNPLINVEILNLCKNVNDIICNEYGYNGIYIIFDEFSKFIESHDKTTVANDMKILQDVCELSADSGNNQIHITLVAHKSIKEYGDVLPINVINAFTVLKVE
jgi:hypothetical protein